LSWALNFEKRNALSSVTRLWIDTV